MRRTAGRRTAALLGPLIAVLAVAAAPAAAACPTVVCDTTARNDGGTL